MSWRSFEQLKRLQTDYVDNYLMHMLPDVHIWKKLVRMGILDWINEKRKTADSSDWIFLPRQQSEFYGASWMPMIGNFVKSSIIIWIFTTGPVREGVAYAAKKKGIPVIIMEPLRGGRLVNGLPKKAKGFVCGSRTEAQSGRMGASLALESAGD